MPDAYMDYAAVEGLAEQVGSAQTGLASGRDAVAQGTTTEIAYATYYVDDFNAFGDTPAAARLASAHGRVRDAARTAADHLAGALGEDVTRLRDAVTLFQERDHEEADRLLSIGAGGPLTVYSTHVHASGSEGYVDPTPYAYPSGGRPPTGGRTPRSGVADAHVRAGQIDRFRGIFEQSPGVVGADFNAEARNEAGDHGPGGVAAAEALERFEDRGHDLHAGRLADGQGTSPSGYHIDYVVTAPGVGAEDPQRVDGGSSDHDGQQVDLTVPRW